LKKKQKTSFQGLTSHHTTSPSHEFELFTHFSQSSSEQEEAVLPDFSPKNPPKIFPVAKKVAQCFLETYTALKLYDLYIQEAFL